MKEEITVNRRDLEIWLLRLKCEPDKWMVRDAIEYFDEYDEKS